MSSFPKSRAGQIGIAAASLIFLGLYTYAVIAVWRADWLQDEGTPQSLEASARLMPWDARTHWLLGRYFLNTPQDQTRARADFDRAVKLDPFEGRYWLDLAAADEVGNDTSGSEVALERAVRAEPTSPSIAWESANFYLAQNDVDRALPLFRVAIQYGTEKTGSAALDLCWRATNSVKEVVNQVLPAQPAPYFVFLKMLTTRNEMAPANELWQALAAQKFSFSVEQAFPYFDYLVDTQQVDQAKNVWKFLGEHDPELMEDAQFNIMTNGGFEGKYLNGGFGWRDTPHAEVAISLDSGEFHAGTRALRFKFTGPALSETGIYQYVPIQPSTTYRLSAFAKAEDIISASGPRLVVQDSYSSQSLATTDDSLGTTGWRQLVVDFTTGSAARLITVKVMRVPGNPLIKGTFWLDDVKLTPIAIVADKSKPL